MSRRWVRLLLVPVLAVAVAQVLRQALEPWFGPLALVQMFSFLAVFLSAWAGGFWAGLIATGLSVVFAYVAIRVSTGAWAAFDVPGLVRIAAFAVITFIFSAVTEAHLRAQRRLQQQRNALEEERARREAADAQAGEADRARRNFEFLVRNASDFIGISDLEFKPSYVNKAGRQLVGVAPDAPLPNASVLDFFFEEDRLRMVNEFFPAVLQDGHASTEIRFRHFASDAPIWMHYMVVRLDGVDGRPTGYATISRDLSEHKRTEQLLRDSSREKEASLAALRAADRQKDEFLGMLAHEIRNPLAPLMDPVSVLERKITDTSLSKPLDVMGRQVRRMIRIVDDLLDVSRVTTGKISLRPERVEIGDLVTHAVESTRPAFQAHAHVLDLDIADRTLTVWGYSARLGQVLENLLNNAVKYTPPGGHVRVSVTEQHGEIAIAVSDNGIGIDAGMLPRVFDLFVQADTALDRAEGGLGIGLTLVDCITRLHRGRVDVRSDGAGKGSTFTVRLPRYAELPPVSSGDGHAARPGVTPRRILVIDDNADSAETLGVLLELHGHEVQRLPDGHRAVADARIFRPDLVLLDISLPGLDGFQVLRALRDVPELAGLTIVATTGYGRTEDRVRCLEAGFNEHLVKPVDMTQIERVLAGLPAAATARIESSEYMLKPQSLAQRDADF